MKTLLKTGLRLWLTGTPKPPQRRLLTNRDITRLRLYRAACRIEPTAGARLLRMRLEVQDGRIGGAQDGARVEAR